MQSTALDFLNNVLFVLQIILTCPHHSKTIITWVEQKSQFGFNQAHMLQSQQISTWLICTVTTSYWSGIVKELCFCCRGVWRGGLQDVPCWSRRVLSSVSPPWCRYYDCTITVVIWIKMFDLASEMQAFDNDLELGISQVFTTHNHSKLLVLVQHSISPLGLCSWDAWG